MPLGGPTAPIAIAAAFSAALARGGAPCRLALAVSGGADSMAMAHLAVDHCARLGGAALLLTVDHALRPGSADDAAFAAEAGEALGVEARILTRRGPAPATGVQAHARAARYILLAEAAAAWGADALLVAHTADDQAETAAMRAARSARPRGLAGMREAAFIAAGPGPEVKLLRPLLGVGRQGLRDLLRARGAGWREDPSNDDPRYERVRVRRALAADPEETQRLFDRVGAARAAIDAADAAALALFEGAGGAFGDDGAARLPADAADAALAARLIRAIGAGRSEPDEAAAAAALDAARKTGAATLGGAMLGVRGGLLTIYREPAALLGRAGEAPLAPRALAPGARALFDARFIVEAGAEPAMLRPRGGAGPGATTPSTAPAASIVACLVAERFYRRTNRFHEDYDNVTGGNGAALS